MSINLTNRSIVVRNQGDQFVILEGDKQKLIDLGLVDPPVTPMMPMLEETKDETPIIVPKDETAAR